jgi:exopolyphosphatase / guanosine-5'-triphosphate,3'-diphosphate pyrophosphatase
MRIAIIDLGTNTFNLLIAEKTGNNSYSILLNTKEGVKLGEGGINRRYITEAASQRGIDAIARHYDRMKPFNPDKIVAFATSAIRDAENGAEFANRLKTKFNLKINIIDGDKEAELIYLGVKQTLTFTGKRFIILDIGGGSNEFIIADDNGILWKQSFPLGMARLLDRFKPSDPITSIEIKAIEEYIEPELAELFEKIDAYKPDIFVGASGSFDSFILMLSNEGLLNHVNGDIGHLLPLEIFQKLHQKLIQSTIAERDQMNGLEPVRRDMIVLATLFVNFVLQKSGLTTVYQSAYSLKEGAIWEMINSSDLL